ncbi:MAG: superoxide dismutase [Oscillospiraceae bacterium]|nr:superoxide dismutase [Oscillospiraceae bacterium]
MENNKYPFINLPLPYEYDALEPYIDRKTMHLHHDKHLQTYIDKLNKAIENQPKLQNLTLDQLIRYAPQLPCALKKEIRNNAGGVFNHRFYFNIMQNYCEQEPTGRLAYAICQKFGSYDGFKEEFKKAALGVFGSGYAWLVYDRGKLMITTTANQDTPIEKNLLPLVCIDVWEHAYYLKYYNVRAEYVENWMKLINWSYIQQLYMSLM